MSHDKEAPKLGGHDVPAKKRTFHGPKASIATFVRPSDGVRIYIFARKGEADEAAIRRVKKRNGASEVEHNPTTN